MLRRHRLLVGVLCAAFFVVAVAPLAVAAPAPLGMGWTVIDRYGGDDNGDGLIDDPPSLRPADLNAFAVRVLPSSAICAQLGHATWRVDGDSAEPLATEPGSGCGAVFRVEGEGDHTIKVLARNRAEVARVEVDDRLIVALGDSVASGEGNPEGAGPERWLDPACHRSAAAGFQQAANQLGKVDRRRSITFVSLACSGARIDRGLLGSYAGIDPLPGGASYLPQVDRLREIDRRRRAEGGSGVDAVLLSIGANDVRFSSVVKRCALPGDCRDGVKATVERRLGELDDRYDELGAALAAAAPETPVFISEYFDPTHDEFGRFCKNGPGATSDDESQWAYEQLLRPLNREVRTAAERNGWQPVGGIAADFEHHGYCAGERRWVRTLSEALSMGNPAGTLHPNEEGHKAIARRVAGPLAAELHFLAPAAPPEGGEEDGGLPSLGEIGRGVATGVLAPQLAVTGKLLSPDLHSTWRRILAFWLLLPLLIGLLWLSARALMLLRATWPPDPVGRRQPPRLRGRRVQLSIGRLLLIAFGVVVLFAAMVVLAGLAGRAILWLRFWSSRLPADQALSAVSGEELVSTGAVALAIFVSLGLVAAAIAWLLDGNGREVRTTRRGLVAIGLAEVVVAIWIGDFRGDQGLRLFVGVAIAALLLHYLVDRALEWRGRPRGRRGGGSGPPEPLGKQVWGEIKAEGRELVDGDRGWGPRAFQLLPFLLLALALYLSFGTEGFDRLFVAFAYLAAAILFAAPGGLAAPGVRWREPSFAALTVPRVALASAGLTIVVVFLVRDELWLAGAAATAVLLGLICLAVASASGQRFAPYGLAVLVSVPLFAGTASFLHGLDSPELQPIAVVLADGETACGAYVGESDGRLWLAHVTLDERADVHRPRSGAISPLDADRVAAKAVGPLTPVDLLEPRAVELRDRLLEDGGDGDPRKRAPVCDPSPRLRESLAAADPPGTGEWRRRLAERYQPELVVDRRDGFWPVPVGTLFSIRDRRASICRRVAGGGEGCLRLGTPGQFPWVGGEGESLEFPAADNDVDEQHDQMVAALGSADPEKTAAEYYLVHGRPGGGPISIQYWFFYPFNYQPVGDGLAEGGFHEADFESIGVLLSGRGEEPRYVWMNRHDQEGRAFPWDDEALSRPDGHPRVFAARGSHATYENCEGQVRPLDVKGLIDDHPTCDSVQQLHLLPEVTPLIDLSKVGWGCWHGLFGHRNGGLGVYEGSNKFLIADAPKSPLWQQKFGGEEVAPCRGLEDPGGRDGSGEEVLEESTGVPAKLRHRASPLERAIDDCSDWEKPATSGVFMVVCDESALDRYVAGGLDDPGPWGVRIKAIDSSAPASGPAAVPALRRNRSGTYLDDWQITTAQGTDASVYASCPSGERVVVGRFDDVRIQQGQALSVDDKGPGGVWVLEDSDGAPVAETLPFTTKAKKGLLVPRAPVPGTFLPCGH
jgi:lysophospholipase L1-like esterase